MRCYCPTCMREFAVDPVLVNANVRCPACEMLFDPNEHIVSDEDVASKQEETRKKTIHLAPVTDDARVAAGGFALLLLGIFIIVSPFLFCCVLPQMYNGRGSKKSDRETREMREADKWLDDRLDEGHTLDELDDEIRKELRRRGESTDY